MLPYKTLIPLDRCAPQPLYMQVCNCFITLITQGRLQPLAALPSSRKLAGLLLINRNTANLAFDELISQGWAEANGRKGIFVVKNLPNIKSLHPAKNTVKDELSLFSWNAGFEQPESDREKQKTILTIDDGLPDVRLAPIDALMTEYRSISKRFNGKSFLTYGDPRGCINLRAAISRYLSTTRGITIAPGNLIITKGSQMAIYLVSQLLIEPGDTIAVGASNYPYADDTFKICKANLARIPIDRKGMDTEYLENLLKTTKIKAVYVIPQYHCPTTVTLSMDRRLKLLQLAEQYNFAIIEDNYDSEYHYENEVYIPLASLSQSATVIYIGSFSKSFAPSLRIGFLSGPEKFIEAMATLRKYIDRQGDTLMEEALAALLNNGEIDRHFRKSGKIYKERRDIFCQHLTDEFSGHIQFKVPAGGLAVWCQFPQDQNLVEISEKARKAGLTINNGKNYKNDFFYDNALRLGFASLSENEIHRGLNIFKKALNS